MVSRALFAQQLHGGKQRAASLEDHGGEVTWGEGQPKQVDLYTYTY